MCENTNIEFKEQQYQYKNKDQVVCERKQPRAKSSSDPGSKIKNNRKKNPSKQKQTKLNFKRKDNTNNPNPKDNSSPDSLSKKREQLIQKILRIRKQRERLQNEQRKIYKKLYRIFETEHPNRPIDIDLNSQQNLTNYYLQSQQNTFYISQKQELTDIILCKSHTLLPQRNDQQLNQPPSEITKQ